MKLTPAETQIPAVEYRYSEVVDHRSQKETIGEVFDPRGIKLPVTIQGGLEASSTLLFQHSVQVRDSRQREIQVRIYELRLDESLQPKTNLYEGRIGLVLGFFVLGSFEPIHLVDYTASTQYQRSGFRMSQVEKLVNDLLLNSLNYFDTWIKSQSLGHRALADTFRLKITDRNRISTPEKVHYDRSRPLAWTDFVARPTPDSRNNAEIFTSFSLEGLAQMDSGAVVQTLEVDVYMLPNQSWVKAPSDYGLNHEQRHFDLVRIVVDRLIRRLEDTEMSLARYHSQLNDAYLDAYREMNRLQEFYETGTDRGRNAAGQSQWNEWIDQALLGDWSMLDALLERPD